MRPPTPPRSALFLLAALAAVLVIGYTLWTVNTLAQRVDTAQAAAQKRAAQRDANAEKVDALAAQVEALGEEPVVEPGPEPEPQPRGMTEDRVRALVAVELLSLDVDLTSEQISQIARVAAAQIPEPERGPPPSEAEVRSVVAAVVEAVCANDACRGTQGPPGPQGEQGPRGETGTAPTDEQIAAAVAAYCDGRGGCQGARGEPGSDGQDGADGARGADGRGIASTQCVSDGPLMGGHWEITYTDGTTDTDAGRC